MQVEEASLKKACFPDLNNGDVGAQFSVNGTPLLADSPAVPCGLFPKYFPFGRLSSPQTT